MSETRKRTLEKSDSIPTEEIILGPQDENIEKTENIEGKKFLPIIFKGGTSTIMGLETIIIHKKQYMIRMHEFTSFYRLILADF